MSADPVDDVHRTPSGRRRIDHSSGEINNSTSRRRYAPDVAQETSDKKFRSSREYSDEALRQKRYKPEPELDFLRPGARWCPAGTNASSSSNAIVAAPPLPQISRPSTTTSSRKVTSASPRLMQPLRADVPPPPPLQKTIKVAKLDEKFMRQYKEGEIRQRKLELLKAQLSEQNSDAGERVDKAFDGSDEEFIERFFKDPTTHKSKTMEHLQMRFVPPPTPRRMTAEELKASTARLYATGMERTRQAMQKAVAGYVGRVSPPRNTISREAMMESAARLHAKK